MSIQKIPFDQLGSIKFGIITKPIKDIKLVKAVDEDGNEYNGHIRTVEDPKLADWTNMYLSNEKDKDILMITVNRQLNIGWVRSKIHRSEMSRGELHVEYTQ